MALRISRDYEIGRIFESLYLCRRWEGNSDSALPHRGCESIRSLQGLAPHDRNSGSYAGMISNYRNCLNGKCEPGRSSRKASKASRARRHGRYGSPGSTSSSVTFPIAWAVPRRLWIGSRLRNAPAFCVREIYLRRKRVCSLIRTSRSTAIRFRSSTVTSRSRTNTPPAAHRGPVRQVCSTLPRPSPGYFVIYNGPECGASAPDHMHFQAGSRELFPIRRTPPG